MRTGQIERTQLTPEYSAQLTDDTVEKMAAYLSEYKCGASPMGAQILRIRTIGEQTFYDVKLSSREATRPIFYSALTRKGKLPASL
jgi:hypothetical protein